ncbi:MAG: FAD-dependent oxidoreductase [Rhodoglobus sp.]
MTHRVDTLVIGGGVMGLAAAWQVSLRGREVMLLERFTIGNGNGASHGASRNFNQAYSDPGYVDMLVEAGRLWRELESAASTTVLELTGVVSHGRSDLYGAVHAALAAAGIPSEFLDPHEAGQRWSGIRFDTEVLFVPESGRIRSDAALAVLASQARSHGADIRENTRVHSLQVLDDDRVRVVTDDGEIFARHVIVTVGGWTSQIAGGLIALPRLVVTQEQPAHFAQVVPGEWPGFNHAPALQNPRYGYWPSAVYGLRTPGEGIKVGWHGAGPVTDPDARTFESELRTLAALQRYVEEWVPGADPTSFTEISCTYTTTPDSNFVLSALGPVTVGAGFSGHGFKFAPAVGRILADLAEGRDEAPILGQVPF